MQIWYPGPEVRDDGDYPVRLNPGTTRPFATITLSEDSHTALIVQSAQEADRLITAAVEAKRLLSPPAATSYGLCECSHGGVVHAGSDPYRCLHKGCGCERFRLRSEHPTETKPTAHMCSCGHFEAFHIGAVLSDDNPGECTMCDDCRVYEAASKPTGMQSPAPVVRVVDKAAGL